MSGNGPDDGKLYTKAASSLGATLCLPKPIKRDALLAALNAVTGAGRSAIHARELTLAGLAAENVMNAILLDADPVRGVEDDRGVYTLAGTEYDWVLEVEDTPVAGTRQLVLTLSDDQGEISAITTFGQVGS